MYTNSFRFLCTCRNKGCNNQFPGVYSRASFFYDWIATTVCRVSTDPPEYFDCISRTEPPTISLAPSRAPSLPPSSVPSISILPTESVSLGLVAWKPTQKLTWCQGHCDSDKQCAGDLVCFERSDGPVVPGCTGNGKNFLYTNFCVHKDATFSPTLTPTKSPAPTVSEKPSTVPSLHPSSLPTISFAPTIRAALKFVGWKPSVALTWCQGHCDKDIDCAGDLVCFQHADSQVIPGCAGNGKSFLYTNFCVHKDHTFSPTIAPTKSADPTISTVPTTTPTLYPTTVPTTSLAPTQTVSLKFVAWAPSELLGWCQGHCRRDSDCAGDMECFQRSGSRVVPGCTGNGNNFPYTNFCVLKDHTFSPTITPTISPAPTASPEPSAAPTSYPTTIESVALQFVAWKPNTPLGWCEGHCNSDIDCAGNFVCYQRGLSEVVPGCAGDAKKFLYANFCAHKDHTFSPTISPTKSAVPTVSQFPSIIPSSYPTNVPSTSTAPTDTVVLEFIAWAPSEPLGWCQGHCTSDVQCAGDLVCFQRSSTLVVPGCAGNSKNFLYTNFCVYKDHTYSPTIAPTISPAPTISRPPSLAPSPHPTSEPSVSSLPTEVAELEFVALVPWEPLGWCQGNCIWDQDCADDLVCFQRSVSSVVPGCSGDGESFQYTNFCVYAHHTIAPTIAPTTSAAPTMSKAPVTPTLASQTTNAAPIQQPPNTASSTSSAPIQSDMLEFVGWDPIEPLGHCQGDCDRDADCAGDMVCYDRPSRSSSVPGCADSSGFISSISSFCVQGSI